MLMKKYAELLIETCKIACNPLQKAGDCKGEPSNLLEIRARCEKEHIKELLLEKNNLASLVAALIFTLFNNIVCCFVCMVRGDPLQEGNAAEAFRASFSVLPS